MGGIILQKIFLKSTVSEIMVQVVRGREKQLHVGKISWPLVDVFNSNYLTVRIAKKEISQEYIPFFEKMTVTENPKKIL